MKMFRATTAAVIAATLGGAMPATAQVYRPGYGYGYDYGRYDRYRHRRSNDAGAVIAGVAAVGIIAAIASAASRSKRERGYGGGVGSEREAAEVCALSAEQRYGAAARARINDVFRTRDGYDVRGTIEAGYNGRYSDRDAGFDCSVRYGRVEDVRFDRY